MLCYAGIVSMMNALELRVRGLHTRAATKKGGKLSAASGIDVKSQDQGQRWAGDGWGSSHPSAHPTVGSQKKRIRSGNARAAFLSLDG